MKICKQRVLLDPTEELGPSPVARDGVDRDAQNLGIAPLELGVVRLVRGHLGASDTGPVECVEGEHDVFLAAEVAEPHAFAAAVAGKFELRRRISDPQGPRVVCQRPPSSGNAHGLSFRHPSLDSPLPPSDRSGSTRGALHCRQDAWNSATVPGRLDADRGHRYARRRSPPRRGLEPRLLHTISGVCSVSELDWLEREEGYKSRISSTLVLTTVAAVLFFGTGFYLLHRQRQVNDHRRDLRAERIQDSFLQAG